MSIAAFSDYARSLKLGTPEFAAMASSMSSGPALQAHAQQLGYVLSADDAAQIAGLNAEIGSALATPSAEGRLSDEDLSEVSGGVSLGPIASLLSPALTAASQMFPSFTALSMASHGLTNIGVIGGTGGLTVGGLADDLSRQGAMAAKMP
ncbi:hypothetical protein ACLBXM_03575 [Xanthobacteraceae bacterium A53D]